MRFYAKKLHPSVPSLILCCILLFVFSESFAEKREIKKNARDIIGDQSQLNNEIESLFEEALSSGQIADKAAFLINLTRGFEVSEDALGDMNQDGYINIYDIIRLRNITLGIGDPASSYELDEGDLLQDNELNIEDVLYFRDVLLKDKAIPHIIGSDGGVVDGVGLRITVPAGAVEDDTYIGIERKPAEEMAAEYGLDLQAEADDSSYFMGGFRIVASTLDFNAPLDVEIVTDSVPPCAYEGFNLLAAAVPDRDGDGLAELFVINELLLSRDSSLITGPIAVMVIDSVVPLSATPGEVLYIYGENFGRYSGTYFVTFKPISDDTLYVANIIDLNDSTAAVKVPFMPASQCSVWVTSLLTGLESDKKSIEVLPLTPAADPRPIFIANVQEQMDDVDSLMNDPDYLNFDDPDLNQFFADQLNDMQIALDSQLATLQTMPDSILDQFAEIAAYLETIDSKSIRDIQRYINSRDENRDITCDNWRTLTAQAEEEMKKNATQYWIYSAICYAAIQNTYGGYSQADCVGYCVSTWNYWALATHWAAEAVKRTNEASKCVCAQADTDCKGCDGTVYAGYSSSGSVEGGITVDKAGIRGKSWTDGMCTNITNYGANQCMSVPTAAECGDGSRLKCGESYLKSGVPDKFDLNKFGWHGCLDKEYIKGSTRSTGLVWAHPGSIIKFTNATAPYNIVAILNENGRAFIPRAPLGYDLTLSLYDPIAGLYDDNIGTITTCTDPGCYDIRLCLFMPDTSSVWYVMEIGDQFEDYIGAGHARVEYMLYIGSGDVGTEFSFGFSSIEPMTLWIQDPLDNFIYRDSLTDCLFYMPMTFDQEGYYKFTVTYGAFGNGEGDFALGVNTYPYPPPPISYFCNEITYDSLYLEYSPYTSRNDSYISPDDSVIVKPGVEIKLDEGAQINVMGSLRGSATDANPIIIGPRVLNRQKGEESYSLDEADLNRKEVVR